MRFCERHPASWTGDTVNPPAGTPAMAGCASVGTSSIGAPWFGTGSTGRLAFAFGGLDVSTLFQFLNPTYRFWEAHGRPIIARYNNALYSGRMNG